jgi:hypothetical protein
MVANPEMGDGEMPAETIYGKDVDVRVSWGGEGMETVQIVTQAPQRDGKDDPTERLIGVINEWLSAAGEPTIDLAKVKKALPYAPFFDGWWATLDDWGSINRLIKVLQRARDRSYGTPA